MRKRKLVVIFFAIIGFFLLLLLFGAHWIEAVATIGATALVLAFVFAIVSLMVWADEEPD